MQDILGDNSEVPMRVRNWYKSLNEAVLKPLLLRPEVHCTLFSAQCAVFSVQYEVFSVQRLVCNMNFSVNLFIY